MSITVDLQVNGRAVRLEVEPETLLVEALRTQLQLTGTHVGCDSSQCGACVVHVDSRAVKSCTMLAVQAAGTQVTTIEGLGSPGALHPLQAAFREHHALQCGYCTPGMIMSAADLLAHNPKPSRAQIVEHMSTNICRCGSYQRIVRAVERAAKEA